MDTFEMAMCIVFGGLTWVALWGAWNGRHKLEVGQKSLRDGLLGSIQDRKAAIEDVARYLGCGNHVWEYVGPSGYQTDKDGFKFQCGECGVIGRFHIDRLSLAQKKGLVALNILSPDVLPKPKAKPKRKSRK